MRTIKLIHIYYIYVCVFMYVYKHNANFKKMNFMLLVKRFFEAEQSIVELEFIINSNFTLKINS